MPNSKRARSLTLTLIVAATPVMASGVTKTGHVFVIMNSHAARAELVSPIVRRKLLNKQGKDSKKEAV